MHPNIQRDGNPLVNGYIIAANEVEKIARKYGDNYRVKNFCQKLFLDGISDNALPFDTYINNEYHHYYPAGDVLDEYNEQLYKTHCDVVIGIQEYKAGNISAHDIIKLIAKHYQYGANARPYNNINNSLFMNEVNTYLELAGLPKMTHGELLDHAAQRLQSKNFVKYFSDYYFENTIE